MSKRRRGQSVCLNGWRRLPTDKHQLGQVCEAILTEHMMRLGYYIFRPLAHQGPCDLICINEEGEVVLLDSKSDAFRVNPGRTKPDRIYRKRSTLQKCLNVRMAYVDADTRNVYIKPPLDEPTD